MNMRENNKTGFIFKFYRDWNLIYVGRGRSLGSWLFKKMVGIEFDSLNVEEVPLKDLRKRKRELVFKYSPVYNKREIKGGRIIDDNKPVLVSKLRVPGLSGDMSYKDKLDYCGKTGMSLADLEKKLKGLK